MVKKSLQTAMQYENSEPDRLKFEKAARIRDRISLLPIPSKSTASLPSKTQIQVWLSIICHSTQVQKKRGADLPMISGAVTVHWYRHIHSIHSLPVTPMVISSFAGFEKYSVTLSAVIAPISLMLQSVWL